MPRDVFAPFTEASSAGVLLAWKCRVGDHVRAGEALAEIETDKATIELEAPADGVILALLVAPGQSFSREMPALRIEPRSLGGRESDLARNPVVPVRAATPEARCKFCQALAMPGRHDCVRCGAPL